MIACKNNDMYANGQFLGMSGVVLCPESASH